MAWGDDPVPENDQSPLGTRELAEMTGMSATFIREETRAGVLRAVAIGRGRRRVFRIFGDGSAALPPRAGPALIDSSTSHSAARIPGDGGFPGVDLHAHVCF